MAEKSTGCSYSLELRQPNVTLEKIAQMIEKLERPVVVVCFDYDPTCSIHSGYRVIKSIVDGFKYFYIDNDWPAGLKIPEDDIKESLTNKESIVINFMPSVCHYQSHLTDRLRNYGAETIIGVKMRKSGSKSDSASKLYGKGFDFHIVYDIDWFTPEKEVLNERE